MAAFFSSQVEKSVEYSSKWLGLSFFCLPSSHLRVPWKSRIYRIPTPNKMQVNLPVLKERRVSGSGRTNLLPSRFRQKFPIWPSSSLTKTSQINYSKNVLFLCTPYSQKNNCKEALGAPWKPRGLHSTWDLSLASLSRNWQIAEGCILPSSVKYYRNIKIKLRGFFTYAWLIRNERIILQMIWRSVSWFGE